MSFCDNWYDYDLTDDDYEQRHREMLETDEYTRWLMEVDADCYDADDMARPFDRGDVQVLSIYGEVLL